MNAASIAAVITAATAMITALITLITVVAHLIRHQPIPGDNPPQTTVKPSLINPSKPE